MSLLTQFYGGSSGSNGNVPAGEGGFYGGLQTCILAYGPAYSFTSVTVVGSLASTVTAVSVTNLGGGGLFFRANALGYSSPISSISGNSANDTTIDIGGTDAVLVNFLYQNQSSQNLIFSLGNSVTTFSGGSLRLNSGSLHGFTTAAALTSITNLSVNLANATFTITAPNLSTCLMVLDGNGVNLGSLIITGAKLSVASVEFLIDQANTLEISGGATGGTLNFSGGTSAGISSLSATTQAQVTFLTANGWTITLNP